MVENIYFSKNIQYPKTSSYDFILEYIRNLQIYEGVQVYKSKGVFFLLIPSTLLSTNLFMIFVDVYRCVIYISIKMNVNK